MATGRAWAEGRLLSGGDDELAADAAFWGVPAAVLPAVDEEAGLWPAHLPALQAWLQVAGQWRVVAAGDGVVHWLGLDHAAARAGWDLAGCAMTPELWRQVRLIEAGAREVLNRRPQ